MSVDKDKESIFLLSTANCLKQFQLSAYAKQENLGLICTSREAMISCEVAGIAYKIPEDYYNLKQLTLFTRQAYDLLQSYCAEMDRFYHEKISDLQVLGILPFRFSFYYLKIIHDTIAVKIYFLNEILKTQKPHVIYYFNGINKSISSFDEKMLFKNDINLYAYILSGFGNIFKQYETKFIGVDRIVLHDDSFHYFIRNHISSCSTLVNVFNKLKMNFNYAINSLINYIRLHNKSIKLFFCPDIGHDILFILKSLNRNNIYQYYYRFTSGSRILDERKSKFFSLVFNDALNNSKICDFFCIDRVNFFPIVRERIYFLLTHGLVSAINEYARIEKIIIKNPEKFLWTLTGSVNGLGIAVRSGILAAQNKGIKLITYQEGGGYGQDVSPICDYGEMRDGDIFLCYGEGNRHYYDTFPSQTKLMIPVGSARQDIVYEKCNKKTPSSKIVKIMYLFNQSVGNTLHAPNNSALTDTHYCQRILKISEQLHKFPAGVQISIKPNPCDNLFFDFFCMSTTFNVEKRFLEDCLDDIDLFLIDYPSTTLLTCLNTNAFIFIIEEDGCFEFTDEQRSLLSDRVYFFNDIDKFFHSLYNYIVDPPPLRLGSEYRKMYSLYNEDGLSCHRAVSYLLSICPPESMNGA